jgi:hypothetical protein
MGMTCIFFFAGSVVFLFLFSNIFLAIMMNAYEVNIGQVRKFEAPSAKENSEELNLVKALLYCTVKKEGVEDDDMPKKEDKKRVRKGDGYVLGIDQTSNIETVPIWQQVDFDPFDPDSKYNEIHYLSGLNSLTIDMQMKNMPLKVWAGKTASQILDELRHRTLVRSRVKQLMRLKYKFLQQNISNKDMFDEFEYQ